VNYPGSTFNYKKTILHYTRHGNGTKVLLAFHGFGQASSHFHNLASSLSDQYTIYAIDLFFHGKSHWPLKDSPLTKQYWAELLKIFLAENKVEKFSLMGYSIGAKFVLSTLESFTERVDELILIAPDGIKNNIWYILATSPGWTRQYFRKMIVSPQIFSRFATVSYKLGLLNKKMLLFVHNQMDSREKRLKLYYTWMLCRKLKFDSKHIAHLINSNSIPTFLFLGRYDQIITETKMQSLLKKINKYQLILLNCGHSRLIDEVAKYYSKLNNKV
jgi:pimeloyl-ACP methyl ester carboxylesterase